MSATVGITPMVVDKWTRPGSVVTLGLSVSNKTKEKRTVAVAMHDMTLTPEGVPEAVKESERGLSKWVKAVRPGATFEMAADSAVVVEFDVQVPRDVTGGYYGLIQVTFLPPKPTGGNRDAVIALGQRFYSAVLLTVKGKSLDQKIETGRMFISTGQGERRQPWQAALGIKNVGNLHCSLTGEIVIRAGGSVVDRAPLASGRGLVLPGLTRPFMARGTKILPDGVYLAMAEVRLAGVSRRYQRVACSVPFGVLRGKVTAEELTPEMKAYLDSLSPGFMLIQPDVTAEMPPGGIRTHMLEVRNLLEQEIEVTAEMVDWWRNRDGSLVFGQKLPEQPRSATSMCTIRPDRLKLTPRASGRLLVMVQMPRDAEGEHFAGVTFHRSGAVRPTDPEVILQQTALLTARAKRTERYEGTIREADVVEGAAGQPTFRVLVGNSGNCTDIPRGVVRISAAKGDQVSEPIRFEEPDGILPGADRSFDVASPVQLEPGAYKAEISLSWEKGQKSSMKNVSFEVKATQPTKTGGAAAVPDEAKEEEP